MGSKESILCIIPARGGSKGVKRKNLKLLMNKPLIGWTIDEAKKSKHINKIVVSTDDDEIANTSENMGAEIIRRPKELSGDTSPTIDAVIHALDTLKKQDYNPSYILLLQCTSPLRTVEHIDEAIDNFLEKSNRCDSLISVTKEEHSPWWLKKIHEDGCMEDFIAYDKSKLKRRQDFPETFRLNGAIYIIKTEKLYEYKSFETDKTLSYIMNSKSSIDIDTEEDFDYVEYLIKRR